LDITQELEAWDRLFLLLVARPAEGFEAEFEEISRREIARLWKPEHTEAEDDE
jgi:hypothetical protein